MEKRFNFDKEEFQNKTLQQFINDILSLKGFSSKREKAEVHKKITDISEKEYNLSAFYQYHRKYVIVSRFYDNGDILIFPRRQIFFITWKSKKKDGLWYITDIICQPFLTQETVYEDIIDAVGIPSMDWTFSKLDEYLVSADKYCNDKQIHLRKPKLYLKWNDEDEETEED